MKFGTQIVFEVENPKITLKTHQNKSVIAVLLLNRALCYKVRCTYLPFPKMAPRGSNFFFWRGGGGVKKLLMFCFCKFHLVF